MILLIDMDGVLADFEGQTQRKGREAGLDAGQLALVATRTTWDMLDLPTLHVEPLRALWYAPGFFASMDPILGALDTTRDLMDRHDVFFCSAPLPRHATCAQEKLAWLDAHLGHAASQRLVLTHDKTLVYGDVLVDDKPVITGVRKPDWTHVLFDQPYNRTYLHPQRMNWEGLVSL